MNKISHATQGRTQPGYWLLTGATGLLGRYLLRNLLLRDEPVAVLVRGNRQASAQQRTEAVMAEIEDSLGRRLPRPIVLEGDLTKPELGMPTADVDWARRNVKAILHNAASLSFQSGDRDKEPWISNVTGTRSVLELSRKLGVRQFHHVSTAYVCGQRDGLVLESELDVGQEFHSDYAHSKLEAETMVRSADWLDAPTIYRPSIIVGDSQTGFTNTFHGFYTPFRICHGVINKLNLQDVDEEAEAWSLVKVLGMQGNERKHLVPVDWVGAVIAHLALDRRHHGQVYHLTPQKPTAIAELCDVFLQAVLEHSVDWKRVAEGKAGTGQDFDSLQPLFREQMTVYKSFLRDDPTFDATNTLAHAPHLPCPQFDRETLLRLCKFAVEKNFWWSRAVAAGPPFQVQDFLCRHVPGTGELADLSRLQTVLNVRVSGGGGGDWQLRFDGKRPCASSPGRAALSVADLFTNVDVFRSLAEGETSLSDAIRGGGMTIEPTSASRAEIEHLLENLFLAS